MDNNIILIQQPKIFIVIGCGGIGGNLVRDIPKLLLGSKNNKLMLIDGDIVDENNLRRQPYQNQDLNKNKARALASKINSFYSVETLYYDKYLTNCELEDICNKYPNYIPVFLGCVDNDATRKIIENAFMKQEESIYIDGANSLHEGNIYISYKKKSELYGKLRSDVYELNNDINPGLKSCEDLIAEGNSQILITNLKIATLMLEHVYSILTGFVKVGVTDVDRFKIIHY